MKRILVLCLLLGMLIISLPLTACGAQGFMLGNEVLMQDRHHLIEGKKVGLVTNQSGVNSRGESLIDILAKDDDVRLTALFGPEHGIDGKAAAGAYVKSYIHPRLGIPVYSLYGETRMPTKDMFANIDVLLFDIQDIGARSYTYMSTLNYCMVAAQKYGVPVIVLDRPNPVGGTIVEGPVLEDPYKTFVGVDNLPMAHGMTAGELAKFFNRKIGADLTVVPMKGYKRTMIYQDTGLKWVQTSPNIPNIEAVFGYMATGLGEGTGIYQADYFTWIGGKGIDSVKFANLLNKSGLQGVTYIPETKGAAGGVRLKITDYRTFNPAKAGIYALAYARSLNNFKVPVSSGSNIVMFDKIMGTNKIGQYLQQNLTPQQITAKYAPGLAKFKTERAKYLIPDYGATAVTGEITVFVDGRQLFFDTDPYIDSSARTMVPFRGIAEALGATVDWSPGVGKVTITNDNDKIVFTINSSYVTVNGITRVIDTKPVIKTGRTMVPARYVAEFLGADVKWEPGVLRVIITSKK